MIVFLDFDGVLHPLNRGPADFARTPLLFPLLDEFSEAKVVLSTSWRYTYPFDVLCAKLPKRLADRIVGMTPLNACQNPAHHHDGRPRWPVREHECRDWLVAQGLEDAAWLAVDDDREVFSKEAPVVWCDPREGLTPDAVDQIRARLSAMGGPGDVRLSRRAREGGTGMLRPRDGNATILFLDFDGVLHPHDVWLRGRTPYLRGPGELFMWAPRLESVLAAAPHVQIVLSTSWVRHLRYSNALQALPIALRRRVVGATWHTALLGGRSPDDVCDWDFYSRYEQIARYVDRASLTNWVAVDDAVEDWPAAEYHHLVATDSERGLGEDKALERLAELLARR
ncbi:HAD domain-containing protein [Niveibacterium sp. SC-1]|uniref:HAD domain-containing protein n=1 Tax=Niveibacterium sp. SC-1 TaxID=3135646 RepID=UPI00311EFD8A